MLPYLKKILSVGKNIFIIFIVFFTVINLFLYFMSNNKPEVQGNQIEQARSQLYKYVNDPELNKTTAGKLTIIAYKSLSCAAVGEGCTNTPKDGNANYEKSMTGRMSSLISASYSNPPASGIYWAYSGLQNAGFIPKTFAAEGIGFAAIKPLMSIWKVLRDLAYLILVIVIILIGFMVMFRMKLNPQTVISVESALPKIVISLIYITFSFAIAGFLIDFMYILIVLGVSVLSRVDPTILSSQTQQQYLTANFGSIWDSMFPMEGVASRIPLIGGLTTLFGLGGAVAGLLPTWINDALRGLSIAIFLPGIISFFNHGMNWQAVGDALNGIGIIGNNIGGIVGSVFKPVIAFLLFLVVLPLTVIYGAGWIMGILIFLTMIFLLFRIFFMLFTGYLRILLLIVFAPMFMLFEAIPGKSAFSYWFKHLLADLLMFPIVIFILVLGRILVNIFRTPYGANIPASAANGIPPMWQPPFLYGIDPQSFSMLLGMGLIFIIPDIVKLVKELIGVKDMPIGLKIGTFFGGAGVGVSGGMGLMSQFQSINYGAQALFGQGFLAGGGIFGAVGKMFKGRGSGGSGES